MKFKGEMNPEDYVIFKSIFEKYNLKNVVFEAVKDDTKMTKDEFYKKVKKSMESEKVKMSLEEMKEYMLK